MTEKIPKIVCTCDTTFAPEPVGERFRGSWSGSCPTCSRLWLIEDVNIPDDPEAVMDTVFSEAEEARAEGLAEDGE